MYHVLILKITGYIWVAVLLIKWCLLYYYQENRINSMAKCKLKIYGKSIEIKVNSIHKTSADASSTSQNFEEPKEAIISMFLNSINK